MLSVLSCVHGRYGCAPVAAETAFKNLVPLQQQERRGSILWLLQQEKQGLGALQERSLAPPAMAARATAEGDTRF